MHVPLLDLQGQYRPLRDAILDAVARVCDSQSFIGGPEVDAFERELASYIGARHAIGVSSGTDALLVSLMSLGIKPGDEVITSPFSFFATAGSIVRLGATPKLVDIDPLTFNIDAGRVEAAVTSRTRAIVPVHLYGLCAHMDPLLELSKRSGLPIVEDAAQAIGATYKGRVAGTMGALGCFSFFPSKNLGAFGDAGMVVTNDDGLASEVRLLRNHGAEASPDAPAQSTEASGTRGKYFHKRVGGNFRLDALQAAVLRVKLQHLPAWSTMRRRNADRYNRLFAERALLDRIRAPIQPAERVHIFHQYVVRLPNRDRARAHLQRAGIGTEVYYPIPFHLQECFASLGYRAGDFPEAEAAAREVLALPIYPELTEAEQAAVADSLAEAVP
jgi:dTDP-4-amino-4,6-dideoxygalactose transaminase